METNQEQQASELNDQMLAAEFGDDSNDESTRQETTESEDTSTDGNDVTDDQDESTEQADDEADSTDDSDKSADETEEDDADSDTDAERKQHNKEMAERRINERRSREEQIEKAQQDHIDDSRDDLERQVRTLQAQQYNQTVQSNTDKLTNEYQKAINDFPVLSDSNPAIKARIDRAIDSFQAQHVYVDQYGNPAQVKDSLYEYLKTEADSITELTNYGVTTQAQSKSKQKSKTIATPSRSPKESKDPLMDALLSD